MYRRLVLFTAVILAGLAGLCLLGLHSLRLHAEGLRGRRLAEFAAVAEQVRVDVKRKLEALIGTEQARPYTDYQYYYVPLAANQETALVRSPIGDQLDNGLAYGYFQIDPDGSIVSPYVAAGAFDSAAPELRRYLEEDLQGRLGPALHGHTTISAHTGPETGMPGRRGGAPADLALGSPAAPGTAAGEVEPRQQASSHGAYRIDTFGDDQQVQVVHQERQMVIQNFLNVATRGGAPAPPASHDQVPAARDEIMPRQAPADPAPAGAPGEPANTVPIRIEPFVPIAVPSPKDTIFGHDVYLVRHVHIEQEHLLQGFRLNQERLLDEIAESADRLLRPGMGREIAGDVSALEGKASHVAALDFGFGSLALGLVEINPRRLAHELAGLRYGYVGVMAVVALATVLALGALWRNARAQVVLARKKDDFIAAVSHELRTPLASIRMYTEMLDKGWVRNEAKRAEYYGHMCHETERLSRLIENVLDFSRIERGRKQYTFRLGDINACIRRAVTMMEPCARQEGFEIAADLAQAPPFAFDPDAVVQIVANLLDNAIKYARGADDRTLHVRSRRAEPWVIIEVEDRGPGIPRMQRAQVFDAFYRVEDESCRRTQGAGLGLALVKRFAQAHGGSVQVLAAKPCGTVLRVRLAAHLPG